MKTSLNDNFRLVYDTGRGDLRKVKTHVEPHAASGGTQKTIQRVRVFLDTKKRRGKSVTCITGIQHNPQVIEDLAKTLKQLCGAGGTVKGKTIEIQGDHRPKIIARLKELGYQVQT